MSHPNAAIYNLTSKGIEQIDYYQTEHYQVTRDFLVSPQRMLDQLLDGSAPILKRSPPKKPGRRRERSLTGPARLNGCAKRRIAPSVNILSAPASK